MDDDFELLADWDNADGRARALLVERHFGRLCRFFKHKMADETDELVTATLEACVRERARFRNGIRSHIVILGVAREVLIERLRRHAGFADPSTTALRDLALGGSLVPLSPDERFMTAALRRDPLDDQIALELHLYEGLSLDDVADVLRVAKEQLAPRLTRSLAKLEGELGDDRAQRARQPARHARGRGQLALDHAEEPPERPSLFAPGSDLSARHREDSELLASWRGGNMAAGEDLYDRYASAVLRFFSDKVGEGVGDLTLATFSTCVTERDRIRARGTFRSHLFGMSHKLLLEHLRTRNGGSVDPSMTCARDLAPSASAPGESTDEADRLKEALRSIPLDLQIVVELFCLEELSGSEIADALGVSEGTVFARLRRARELLRGKGYPG